jgi:hypothetical protein
MPRCHTFVHRLAGACSGLMYATVPRITPALVPSLIVVDDLDRPGVDSSVAAFARPKSSTLTTPSGVILMLEGLRSRWTIPAPCAASSASAICAATASASGTGRPSSQASVQRLTVHQLEYQRGTWPPSSNP